MQSYTLKYTAPTVDTKCATSRLNALERAALYGDDVNEQPLPPKKKIGKKGKSRMMGTMMMRVVAMNEGTRYYVGTAGRWDTAHRQRLGCALPSTSSPAPR